MEDHFEVVRSFVVYQPAVRLRCVEVWLEEGVGHTREVAVLGIEARTIDAYRGMAGGAPPSRDHRELVSKGFRYLNYESDLIAHEVLIWDDEVSCPNRLSLVQEMASAGTRFLIDKADSPDWPEVIWKAVEDLKLKGKN